MIDKKTRIQLRSIAATINPVVWIGKEGFTENVIKQIEDELYNHELVKISLQENAPQLTESELNKLSQLIGSDVVTRIGRKIVLYKLSNKKNVKHVL